MGLEVASSIPQLVTTNPVAGDPLGQSDDHIRLIKTVLRNTPLVIDRAYDEYTSNVDLTSPIPLDDTIPQNTEGTQILSASITPKATTSRIRISFQCQFMCGSTGINAVAAVFNNSTANALRSNFATNSALGFAETLSLVYEYSPGSTSAQTYNIRVGPQVATAIRLNGTGSSRMLGGSMAATLILEEIAV